MSTNEQPQTRRAENRGGVCVVIAAGHEQEGLQECVSSVREHTPASVEIVQVAAETAAVNHALQQHASSDVVLLSEPCLVSGGWLERLHAAAYGDTNTATASALTDNGGPLGLLEQGDAREDFAGLVLSVARHTLTLRPRLGGVAAPCVYVRRDALELVGALDEELDLLAALEFDFAQRCLLCGLSHVAADDVVVARLVTARGDGAAGGPRLPAPVLVAHAQVPARLLERYPYLQEPPALADSSVLEQALWAARGRSRSRLWVTIDARALDGAITGTHVHVLELILALARTDALRLRLLVREERIDRETLQLLRGLPSTEILAAEGLDPATPRSTVFHRPQQTFSAGDVALALALGERFVLSQLDLIAYRNPGYFADAGAWKDYRSASRHGLSAAERVIVFSDHTRRELLSDALVDEQRIRIVAPGLDHRAAAEQTIPAALLDDAGALEPGFLLCLGTDFRHKNRAFALRLLSALREEHGWRGSLVLAGTHIERGSSLELERALLDERPELREAVLTVGPVSEREKAWLIAHAGAVVYPSVYEGFGLVPFESALAGVPCVFAPQSSLAEAAPEGTAAIVPWDPSASSAATYALLADPDARERHVSALAAAGRELRWDAAAGAMVEIYREAAAAPVRDAATLARDAVEREARLSVVHEIEARRLVGEREHAQRMYDELNAEVGSGLSLIGPHGALPEDLQRALLALSARPALSRPLFAALRRAFLTARTLARVVRGRSQAAP